ncbi:MAG: hypothetical protein R2792_12145 [Saprospiraceae bacterium]
MEPRLIELSNFSLRDRGTLKLNDVLVLTVKKGPSRMLDGLFFVQSRGLPYNAHNLNTELDQYSELDNPKTLVGFVVPKPGI